MSSCLLSKFQVKALQTPATAEETEISPVHQMFHEESKPDETNAQVRVHSNTVIANIYADLYVMLFYY